MIKKYQYNLKKYRYKAKKHQYELAKIINITPQQYSQIERGKCNLKIEQLLIICDYLGITPNDLLL